MTGVHNTSVEYMQRVREAFAIQANPASLPSQIKEATVWLEQFQNTKEAWQVADQLFGTATSVRQPAARAHLRCSDIAHKIQYDWAELPAETHAALRGSLLAHVLRFGQGPQPVLTQLCLAVGRCSHFTWRIGTRQW